MFKTEMQKISDASEKKNCLHEKFTTELYRFIGSGWNISRLWNRADFFHIGSHSCGGRGRLFEIDHGILFWYCVESSYFRGV